VEQQMLLGPITNSYPFHNTQHSPYEIIQFISRTNPNASPLKGQMFTSVGRIVDVHLKNKTGEK
jgi:hypothetical protein